MVSARHRESLYYSTRGGGVGALFGRVFGTVAKAGARAAVKGAAAKAATKHIGRTIGKGISKGATHTVKTVRKVPAIDKVARKVPIVVKNGKNMSKPLLTTSKNTASSSAKAIGKAGKTVARKTGITKVGKKITKISNKTPKSVKTMLKKARNGALGGAGFAAADHAVSSLLSKSSTISAPDFVDNDGNVGNINTGYVHDDYVSRLNPQRNNTQRQRNTPQRTRKRQKINTFENDEEDDTPLMFRSYQPEFMRFNGY